MPSSSQSMSRRTPYFDDDNLSPSGYVDGDNDGGCGGDGDRGDDGLFDDVEDYFNDHDKQIVELTSQISSGSVGHHHTKRSAYSDGMPKDDVNSDEESTEEDQDESSSGSSDNTYTDDNTNNNNNRYQDRPTDHHQSVKEMQDAVRMNAAAMLKKQAWNGGTRFAGRWGDSYRPRRNLHYDDHDRGTDGIFVSRPRSGNRSTKIMNPRRMKIVTIILGLILASVAIGVVISRRKKHRQYQDAVLSVTSDRHGVQISYPDTFQDENSPQWKALRWMIDDDPLSLPLPKDWHDPFVQRYIVALFVFALADDGPTTPTSTLSAVRDKYQVLSGSHECEWNGQFRRTDADHTIETIQHGILCHNDIDGDTGDGHQRRQKDGGTQVTSPTMTVTSIAMPSSGLAGQLPQEMKALTHLRQLILDNNAIEFNTITYDNQHDDTDSFYQYALPVMSSLTYLSLAYNSLSGTIPDDLFFESMSSLTTLSLSENSLQGFLPSAMASLTNLRVLALDGNELTGGISTSIYLNAMTNLQELYLQYNSFEDRLSNDSFEQLANLKVLDLKSNRLSGPLPDALWSLTNLEVVDVHHNAFDGHINDVVKEGHKLKFVDLSDNLLDKGLPPTMRYLTELTHLDLSYNRFDEILPGVSESGDTSFIFANMTKMKTLLLTENDMFGPQGIPHLLKNMEDLKRLGLRLTGRIGPIPSWLGELTKLELLDLDWNRLTGQVPTELGQLTRLKYLMLNRNSLTGQIPLEVTSSLSRLKIFMIDNNDFDGTVDTCLDGMIHMVADCGNPEDGCPACDNDNIEVTCPCCTSCCDDLADRCNMDDWSKQAEHEFRGDYSRYSYNFDKVDYIHA